MIQALLMGYPRHLYHLLKAHRVRSKNTENSIARLSNGMDNYQRKRYVLIKFFHRERHIVFSDVGKGRRRMEVYDGVEVVMCMNA